MGLWPAYALYLGQYHWSGGFRWFVQSGLMGTFHPGATRVLFSSIPATPCNLYTQYASHDKGLQGCDHVCFTLWSHRFGSPSPPAPTARHHSRASGVSSCWSRDSLTLTLSFIFTSLRHLYTVRAPHAKPFSASPGRTSKPLPRQTP